MRTRPCPITQAYCDDPECGPACVRSIPAPAPAPEGGRPLENDGANERHSAREPPPERASTATTAGASGSNPEPVPIAAADAGRPLTDGVSWMVIRQREIDPPEVYPFADEGSARQFHDKAQIQWSECFLVRVVRQGMQAELPAADAGRPALRALVEKWRADARRLQSEAEDRSRFGIDLSVERRLVAAQTRREDADELAALLGPADGSGT